MMRECFAADHPCKWSSILGTGMDLADSVLIGVLSYLFDILEGVMYW